MCKDFKAPTSEVLRFSLHNSLNTDSFEFIFAFRLESSWIQLIRWL